MATPSVTESGVWLLAAQKPIKRQAGGKESLLYFGCRQWRLWGEGTCRPCPKANSPFPLPPNKQWTRAFIDRRRGLHAETAQSALTVILKLVIGGLSSVILIVLGTVSVQFQGQFVSISLRQILRIVAAYVMAAV